MRTTLLEDGARTSSTAMREASSSALHSASRSRVDRSVPAQQAVSREASVLEESPGAPARREEDRHRVQAFLVTSRALPPAMPRKRPSIMWRSPRFRVGFSTILHNGICSSYRLFHRNYQIRNPKTSLFRNAGARRAGPPRSMGRERAADTPWSGARGRPRGPNSRSCLAVWRSGISAGSMGTMSAPFVPSVFGKIVQKK